jgi:SAM-dependent methyltransferase
MTPHERPSRSSQAHFADRETVAFYARSHGLSACELQVFERYITLGADILDLGVGTGRTTPYLSDKARSYVGVDCAAPMLDVCRARFPELAFYEADASNLRDFSDETFDVVVFSFNGIDYISPPHRRQCCLAECWRVLRDGGVLIISRHNPRAIVRLPPPGSGQGWRAKLRAVAGVPVWTMRRTLRMAVAGGRTFWCGHGAIVEPAKGFNAPLQLPSRRASRAAPDATTGSVAVVTHMATPRRVRRELERAGFALSSITGSALPRRGWQLATPWYYYAATKRSRPPSSGLDAVDPSVKDFKDP